uniref:ATP synthase complex subunit 8 n=1 Tax=Cataclysta lemnata TaxID=1594245 RepID=A0A7D7J6W7_9NEOP|nr:ATP synthase F0 subunit 8 [Cataclysta lemnata]QMP96713.1 ATP synthase F0 subunit 8 [Cataclysta lemnata]
MPQMMPINWLMSFIFFICIYILFNIMNYFIFSNKNKTYLNKSTLQKNLNWKW